MGGDAVKVLAWYRPDADAAVNAHQQRFVREIGEECRRNDIPYVLELLVYPFLGSANHTADYVESPGKLPALVSESVREFSKPDYGVDLLKLESPLAASSLPERDGGAALPRGPYHLVARRANAFPGSGGGLKRLEPGKRRDPGQSQPANEGAGAFMAGSLSGVRPCPEGRRFRTRLLIGLGSEISTGDQCANHSRPPRHIGGDRIEE
jgi:DeoC/LacD family aldolase